MEKFKFSDEEWRNCIKVLEILKDSPFDTPNNIEFKTLITCIHKKAKKEIKKQNAEERRKENIEGFKSSVIVQNALNNKTEYTAKKIEYTEEYIPLAAPIGCYCCNNKFASRHFFYSRLCPECAKENYSRRFATTNLSGYNIVLTGGRVKIGYATCIKLLSMGANVIVTSRFPALLLQSLQNEEGFDTWKDRLTVYGLDLRNLRAVEEFIKYVESKFQSLDILINNAAQTIKYADDYYLPLINEEQRALIQFKNNPNLLLENTTNITSFDQKILESEFKDYKCIEKNRFGQPVDNRDKNSWNSTLEDISLHELLEVNLINQISPYILLKGLKRLMLNSRHAKRFVINVTSSEGQFSYENKTIFHPHTNMTKAALNMLTRTSGEEFARNSIYINSVDVGWVSTGAVEKLRKKQFSEGYIPPLDPVNGASRIFQPIIECLEDNKEPIWGKLIKNYRICDW